MIRRGPRRLRSQDTSSGDRGVLPVLCFFCHRPAPGSPFRSPIPDVIGGRYLICGPQCPERPNGTRVFSIGADWANQGETAS